LLLQDDSTALIVASISGDAANVELLLHAGADHDIKDKVRLTFSFSPFHLN